MFGNTGTTRSSAPRRRSKLPILLAGAATVGVLILLIVLASSLLGGGSGGDPTAEQVIQEFRGAGLEVGEVQPQQPDPEMPLPDTYQEHVRFLIPSAGDDLGGRVFTFESPEDLRTVRSYYEGLNDMGGSFCCSYVYDEGLVLVQIPGDVRKEQADEYGGSSRRCSPHTLRAPSPSLCPPFCARGRGCAMRADLAGATPGQTPNAQRDAFRILAAPPYG